ncbi:hypothetical protein MMC07_005171 [Pseudocyphellaria aurata]|nr:hypothetical protein [Pseudocyphellaria aurata]
MDMDIINQSMVPHNFNMSIQDGLFVFAPTAGELWNFQSFINKVEDIIGRKRGFAKIVIPNTMKSNYHPPHPIEYASSAAESSSDRSSASIRPHMTRLDHHEPFESNIVIYRVRMLGAINVRISEWQASMQKYQKEIMKRPCESPFHTRDVDEEVRCTPGNEKKLVADSERTSDDMYYTRDIQESHPLRRVLRVGGPYLNTIRGRLNPEGSYASDHDMSIPGTSFIGNRREASGTKAPQTDRSQFQLAGGKGSPFGLEMTANAAYSLNYLHRGAPKRWVIIEPDAHPKLEELLYPQVEFAAGRLVKKFPWQSGLSEPQPQPPTHPPLCDRFLSHQPFYVPKETLAMHSIPYTEIVQYEGDMIITFPFAYYQGFSSGPSVAEVIPFGNHRWETIRQSRLYQPCHANCSGPADPAPDQCGQSDGDDSGKPPLTVPISESSSSLSDVEDEL